MITIGIVAGEPSGDALGALLVEAVRTRFPQVRFVGIGGPRMQAAGVESWYPIGMLAVRGLVEVLGRISELVRLRRTLVRRLLAQRVQLFIGVDAPDFNLGVERTLKRRRVRTMHFVSPSVWAWRRERIPGIVRSVDRMLVLFPFEPAVYEGTGLDVTFVGHPLAARAAQRSSRKLARERLRMPAAQELVALLPGSRVSEVEMHADLLLRTAALMVAEHPDMRFVVPLATRETRDAFGLALDQHREANLPVTLLYGHATEALQAADIALVASGTATLEAAMARCPHVIFYRVNPLTARMVERKLLQPWVGLPNVIAGMFVVPELLQDNATPANLAQAAVNLFDDALVRGRLEAAFGEMAHALAADTARLTAAAVREELAKAGVAC